MSVPERSRFTAAIRRFRARLADLSCARGQVGQAAPFAPTLALTVEIAFAGILGLMGIVLLVDRPVPIPCFPMTQNQDAETLLYLSAFGAILPLALVIGPRLADRIAGGPNRSGLETLTGVLAAVLAVAIIGIRVSELAWGHTAAGALGAAAIWWTAAVLMIRRAAQPRAWEVRSGLSGLATPIWWLAALLGFGVLLCLTHASSTSPLALPLGGAVVAGGLVAHERVHLPSLGWPWKIGADVLLVALVLLAVPDLIAARPEQAAGNSGAAMEVSIIQFHQNFLLGPANELLAGGAMLVDTASQYGVVLIYMLAAWFTLVPIGYGTLAFFGAAANALVFASGYGVLRIAAVSRLLAAATLAVAVVALVFNATYPISSIPQDSALRFGLPIAVLLPLVAAERWPRCRTLVWGAVVTVTGLSSIWSFEAFVYSLATLAPMLCLASWLRPAGNRLGWLAGRARSAAVACVCAHLLFALVTLVRTAQLPDWGQYLAYLRAFLFGDLGDLNFDFASWSPGLAVGAEYLASAAGIVLLVLRQPDFVRAERTAIFALTGVTAYGIAIFSYFNNRSTDFVLSGVALPAFLAAALWLSLLLQADAIPRPARRGGLALALSVATFLIAVAWSSIGERYPHSALAHLLSGDGSTRAALHRLWHMPPLMPAALEGQRLLESEMPGAPRSLVLTTPDLEIEILLRSRRGNALPIAAPWQDSFVADERLPGLGRAVDGLRGGERMLVDELAHRAFDTLRANPSFDPLAMHCEPGKFSLVPVELAPLQSWALKRIGERFDLSTIRSGSSGLRVVELIPRR